MPRYIDYVNPSTSETTTRYVELADSQFFVTPDGTIYGNASGWAGGFCCKDSNLSWISDGLLAHYQQQDPSTYLVFNCRIDGVSNTGCFGYAERWFSATMGDASVDFDYVFAGDTVYEFPWDPDPVFFPFAMNDSGVAIGYKPDEFGTLSWQIRNGSSTTSFAAGKYLVAINNDNVVLGCEPPGGGFLWQAGGITALEEVIPEDYKAQISGISPRLLSNPNADGVVHILCDATFTDPNDGSTTLKTYVLSGPYAALSSTNCTLKEVRFPDGMYSTDVRCINANGVMAFIHEGGFVSSASANTQMTTMAAQSATAATSSTVAIPGMGILLPVQLTPDYNRDGVIDDKDAGKITEDNPWRWWIDDDESIGDTSKYATPGIVDYSGGSPDCHDRSPGAYGLLDYFLVYFDIKQLIQTLPPSSSVQYKLKQEDGALKFIYTSLKPEKSGDYLVKAATSDYGDDFNSPTTSAAKHLVSKDGVALSTAFLNKIKDDGKGVLLFQVCAKTEEPLVLEVIKDGTKVGEVKMDVKFDGVEKMYRWINLRGAANNGSVGRASDISEPSNYPDKLTNDKHFVFVHGYNVSEYDARGWHAQMFKRLYQTGSKAKFTAVVWHGNQGQWGNVTVDYWENVTNAFLTSPQLSSTVNALAGTKVIAAHSLGNMVVSSAIKDHSLSVSKYFMLDAAVALEAFDATMSNKDQMTGQIWTAYQQRLWSTEWHLLFDPSDGRRKLTWRDRFGVISNAYNFYSSGEDVLNNGNGQVPSIGTEYAWVRQEMVKGTNDIGALLSFDSQGGWGFNTMNYPKSMGSLHPPSQAAEITDAALQERPFFDRFQDVRLMNPSQGSAAANEYPTRAKTLAEGIPSLTFAAGRNVITAFDQPGNIDLMLMEDGWPQDRLNDDNKKNRWLHGDAKDVPYRYNHPLYERWVDLGGLK